MGDSPDPLVTSEPRRSRRTRLTLAVLAVLLLGGGALLVSRARSAETGPRNAPRPAPRPVVVTAPAARGDIGNYLSEIGAVAALHTVTVRTRVDGQITAVLYREGQLVRQGQPLIEIDPRPFQVQVQQAEGQLSRDRALLHGAQVDLERYRPLVTKKAIPEQQLASQQTLVEQYSGTVAADEGVLANARLQLSYCHVAAPIAGRIGLRLVDAGNMVHASDPNGLAVITEVDPIAVLFTIPEDNLPAVLARLRAGAELPVEAWDRAEAKKLGEGAVLTVDNQIDPQTGTIRVKALFPNRDHALFPNQFVNTRTLVDVAAGAVIVPAAAIQRNGTASYVFVVGPDARAERRDVTLGITEPDRVQVRSGVQAGQSVVVDGFDKLQNGMPVEIAGAPRATARSGRTGP